ncbi:class I SAM-dependent methyltransferase [Nocardioides sp. AN3]
MTVLENPPHVGQLRPSQTAEITCAQRAAETLRPSDRRLIDDPVAQVFVTRPLRRLMIRNRLTSRITLTVFDRLYGGFMAVVLLRNRWFEELFAESVSGGVTQVVSLGAGYDTTAWRLDLGGVTLFEVDAPPTQDVKRALTQGLQPRGDLRYVACDFETDSLPSQLLAAGFDPAKPALFVWYGVSFFLTPDAVRATLEDVAALAAAGSRFAWDYLDPSVVDGTSRYGGALRARAAVAKRGEPYTYGLTPDGAEGIMEAHGFRVEDNLSMTQLARRYGGERGFAYSTDDFFGIVTGVRVEDAS